MTTEYRECCMCGKDITTMEVPIITETEEYLCSYDCSMQYTSGVPSSSKEEETKS